MIHANMGLFAYWSSIKSLSILWRYNVLSNVKNKKFNRRIKYTRNRKRLECGTKIHIAAPRIFLYTMGIKWMVFMCVRFCTSAATAVSIISTHIWSTRDQQQQHCHRHLYHYTAYQRTDDSLDLVRFNIECARVCVQANAACRWTA